MVCPEPAGDLLVVDGLSVTYSRQSRPTLDRVTFTVPPGEFVAVTGESGSGKSTLAWAVLGVLPPGARQEGSVRFRGIELTSADEHVRRSIRSSQIAMVFQEPRIALNPVMRVGTQVRQVAGVELQAARHILEQVGLAGRRFFDAYPHELSGGECQRVVLAQALARRPMLIIADEPGSGLDGTLRREVLELLERETQQRGASVLLISHDYELIGRYARSALILERGRIVSRGAPGDVLCAVALPRRN